MHAFPVKLLGSYFGDRKSLLIYGNYTNLAINSLPKAPSRQRKIPVRSSMKTITCFLLLFVALSPVMAQSTYEPYYFTLFAGQPGHLGAADGVGDAATFNAPQGIAVDSLGNVYVADTGNNTIRTISPTGSVVTLAGSPGEFGSSDGQGSMARFSLPQGITVDETGSVYAADTFNDTIRKITPAGLVTTFAGMAGAPGSLDGPGAVAKFSYPIGLSVDTGGNLYVADSGNSTVRKISAQGVVTTLAGSAGNPGFADGFGSNARFCSPRTVAVDGAGNVFVADACNASIRKITADGFVSTIAGMTGTQGSNDGPGSQARFRDPRGVAVDAADSVYVADTANCIIRRISSLANVTTLGGVPEVQGTADGVGNASRFGYPQAIAISKGGRLYVADTVNHTIRTAGPGPASLSLQIAGVTNSLSQLTGVAPPFSSISISSAPDLGTSFEGVGTAMADANGIYRFHDSAFSLKRFYRATFTNAP